MCQIYHVKKQFMCQIYQNMKIMSHYHYLHKKPKNLLRLLMRETPCMVRYLNSPVIWYMDLNQIPGDIYWTPRVTLDIGLIKYQMNRIQSSVVLWFFIRAWNKLISICWLNYYLEINHHPQINYSICRSNYYLRLIIQSVIRSAGWAAISRSNIWSADQISVSRSNAQAQIKFLSWDSNSLWRLNVQYADQIQLVWYFLFNLKSNIPPGIRNISSFKIRF